MGTLEVYLAVLGTVLIVMIPFALVHTDVVILLAMARAAQLAAIVLQSTTCYTKIMHGHSNDELFVQGWGCCTLCTHDGVFTVFMRFGSICDNSTSLSFFA